MGATSPETIKSRLRDAPLVVVVGGGFAGVTLAKALDETFNVLLIDRKDHFFLNFGALRACVQPSFLKSILIPYDKLLKYGSVVQAHVVSVSATEVRLYGRDEPIKFDYCVICTGSSYAFPAKVNKPVAAEVPPMYEKIAALVKEAGHITLVGGGPVGVELLGEIGDVYPDKKMTLVQSRDHLIPRYDPRLGAKLLQQITEKYPNAEVLLNDRLELPAKGAEAAPASAEEKEASAESEQTDEAPKKYVEGHRTVATRAGKSFETDLIFFCGGGRVNSGCYKDTFKDIMNDQGQLLVRDTFQLQGYDNIFAIGDASAKGANVGNLAFNGQAPLTAENIKALHAKKGLRNWPPRFKGFLDSPIMPVTLGSKSGASLFPFVGLVGAKMTSMAKGADLGASNIWPLLNRTVPEELVDMKARATEDDDVERMAKSAGLEVDQLKAVLAGSAEMPAEAAEADHV